ncbi:MAG: hypothetical protein ACOX1A_05570 [Saccharofermentanales bacterium]|jgi:hypothetical protein|nr:hypothetical protein [Clostridiaceae bacterium]
MTKSIFGLKLSAIAILIFVICFFGSIEVLILLGAFALLLEKNRWLTKQAFQALYLKLGYIIALRAVGWVFDFFRFLFGRTGFLATTQDIINFLLGLAFLLLVILAVLRLLREEDADVPFFANLADYTMNIVREKAAPVVPKPVPPAPAKVPPPPIAPVAPVKPATADSTDSWICACGRTNTGRFCMSCGLSRGIQPTTAPAAAPIKPVEPAPAPVEQVAEAQPETEAIMDQAVEETVDVEAKCKLK